MHHFLLLIMYLFGNIIVLKAVFGTGNHEAFIGLFIFSVAVILGWIATFVTKIKEEMEKQVSDLQTIDTAERRKQYNVAELQKDLEATNEAMESYKNEMKTVLVDKYEAFEKTLMENVRDSKIIATMLRKSGYSDLLNTYDKRISKFIDIIKDKSGKISEQERKCLHNKLSAHCDLVARREQGIFGYHWFFPKHLRYNETEAPSEEQTTT
jgi:hypothetical protein